MQTRIYVVTRVGSTEAMLVRASTRAAARNTATRLSYLVDLATQDQLVKMVGDGHKVVEAKADDKDDERAQS